VEKSTPPEEQLSQTQLSQAGYQAGYQAGCQAGYQAGCQAGFQAGSRAGFQSPAGSHADSQR